MSDDFFYNSNGKKISYATVRKGMQKTKNVPYKMSLTGSAVQAVIKAVNQGIDAHLEACFITERGDKYRSGMRFIGDTPVIAELVCEVSEESLPVLLRRLTEQDYAEDDEASTLSEDILSGLGINDAGRYVGLKRLGLD